MLEKFLTEYYCVWVIFLLTLEIWLIDKFYILSIIGVKYGKWSFKIKFRWGWWISDEKI